MALVFPGVMLMQMISAGAMGGGISSAIARALGAGRREEADALVLHALIINVAARRSFSAHAAAFGGPLYRALGGAAASLEAALIYSNVVFAGNVLLWLMNGLASVIRGTGNMLVPALVICAGVVAAGAALAALIFGIGPFPALGIAGGGVALCCTYALRPPRCSPGTCCRAQPGAAALPRLRWPLFRDILRVGAVASLTSVQTNVTIALDDGAGRRRRRAAAVAGYGTGARLEYLLVPLVFGLGAPLVALVGTNIGAGARGGRCASPSSAARSPSADRAIGVAAALWPRAWLALFGADPAVLETGSAYLRVVGPFYGFFGLGLALYFASQGAAVAGRCPPASPACWSRSAAAGSRCASPARRVGAGARRGVRRDRPGRGRVGRVVPGRHPRRRAAEAASTHLGQRRNARVHQARALARALLEEQQAPPENERGQQDHARLRILGRQAEPSVEPRHCPGAAASTRPRRRQPSGRMSPLTHGELDAHGFGIDAFGIARSAIAASRGHWSPTRLAAGPPRCARASRSPARHRAAPAILERR